MQTLTDGTKISVALVDDHPIFLEGLHTVFRCQDPFAVVAKAVTGDEAYAAAAVHRPNLILLDMFLPDGGPQLICRITSATPMSRVVVLSASARDADMSAAFEAGASAYLVKGISASELRSSLLAIQNRHTFIVPPTLAPVTVQQSAIKPVWTQRRAMSITTQEYAVLERVAQGMSNKEVALDLSITEKTVKSHLTTIFSKFGVRNRVEAINVFLELESSNNEILKAPRLSERK